jgi:hypothetical protein
LLDAQLLLPILLFYALLLDLLVDPLLLLSLTLLGKPLV